MSKKIKEEVSFDQYQRYQTISEIINFFRIERKVDTFQLLEIGANEHKDMALFLPKDRILYTDVSLTDTMKLDLDFQQADGTNLPFNDGEFDFVYSCDVLEHIPAEKHQDFISESVRVAKYCAILCFPFSSQDVINAEERVNAHYRELAGEDFIWLEEHRKNGLPKIKKINELLNQMGIPFFSFYHGDVGIWEKIWHCKFDASLTTEKEEIEHKIDYLYNHNLYHSDIAESCYRVFYLISSFDLDQIKKHMKNYWVSTTFEKTAFLELLQQSLNQVYPLRKCLNGLEIQVEKARQTISEKNKEIEYARESISDLKRQVDSSRIVVCDQEEQIVVARLTLKEKEDEIEVAKKTLSSFEKQVTDAKNLIENQKRQIEVARQTIEEKNFEIECARKTLSDLEKQIVIAKSTIDDQEKQIKIAQKTIATKDDEIECVQEVLSDLEKQIFVAKSTIDDQEKQIEIARKTIEEKDAEIESARSTIENMRKQV